MPSLILSTATRFIISLLLMLPVFLLLRGHNLPGGGFVAGLVASTAVALYAVAFDAAATRRAVKVDPRVFIVLGLAVATLAAVFPLLQGKPLLTGEWSLVRLPGIPEVFLGTPLLFDLGVFITVFGVAVTIIFALMEE